MHLCVWSLSTFCSCGINKLLLQCLTTVRERRGKEGGKREEREGGRKERGEGRREEREERKEKRKGRGRKEREEGRREERVGGKGVLSICVVMVQHSCS